MEVIKKHGHDFFSNILRGDERHHLVGEVRVGDEWHATCVTVCSDGCDGAPPNFSFVLLGHVALVLVDHCALWPQFAAHPRRITRHVHE